MRERLRCVRGMRASLLLGAGVILGSACAGELPDDWPGQGGPAGAEPPATPQTAAERYHDVDTRLMQSCASCHAGALEDNFLEPADEADRYERIKQWPGFITQDPAASVLLTYPMANGSHPGQNNQIHPGSSIDDTDGLRPALEAWLDEEARLIVAAAESPLGVGTDPFTPIVPGLNVVYLDQIDPSFSGVLIMFDAEEGSVGLTLSRVQVHTPNWTGVTIDQPRLVIYPLGVEASTAETSGDFNDVKLDVPSGTAAKLGAGRVYLPEWPPGAKLAFYFRDIKLYEAAAPADKPCLALGVFEARAVPQLTACYQCHADPADEASTAMNLLRLADGSAVADTCAEVLRNKVDLEIPAESLIFKNTDPAGAAIHEFQFNNDGQAFSTFRTEVTTWIEAERTAAMSAGQ